MEIKIYQINSKFETCRYAFASWKFAKDKFNFKDYDLVYTWVPEATDHCTDWMILDDVFYIFNQRRPDSFKGHSLSTSDVVEVNGTFWYCDSFGWKDITDVIKEDN